MSLGREIGRKFTLFDVWFCVFRGFRLGLGWCLVFGVRVGKVKSGMS